MKKLIALSLALMMVLGLVSIAGASPEKKTVGFYADNVDSYYVAISDVLKALAEADPEVDWEINVVTGTGSAAEQLNAVQNFIQTGYDAIAVIQNNVETTSECIQLCEDAGVPYIGLTHSFASAPNATDALAFIGYDFVQEGLYAGEDAYKWGAKKVVNIEGVLGQGTAGAQSYGFILGYTNAGADIGDWKDAQEWAAQKNSGMAGGEGLQLYWTSGGWMKDAAKTQMANIITELGPTGFDGVYAQNNPMLEGVVEAMEEAGLDTKDYWIGSGNGREISWNWVREGVTDMDVNQSALLEGEALYQILKAHFAGEEHRKYIHPYFNYYHTGNIEEIWDTLIPFTDVEAYLTKRAAGDIVYDINNTEYFKDVPEFNK